MSDFLTNLAARTLATPTLRPRPRLRYEPDPDALMSPLIADAEVENTTHVSRLNTPVRPRAPPHAEPAAATSARIPRPAARAEALAEPELPEPLVPRRDVVMTHPQPSEARRPTAWVSGTQTVADDRAASAAHTVHAPMRSGAQALAEPELPEPLVPRRDVAMTHPQPSEAPRPTARVPGTQTIADDGAAPATPAVHAPMRSRARVGEIVDKQRRRVLGEREVETAEVPMTKHVAVATLSTEQEPQRHKPHRYDEARPHEPDEVRLREEPPRIETAVRGRIAGHSPASPRALSPPRARMHAESLATAPHEPVVHVSIGRIEVRALTPPAAAARVPARSPIMTIDEYVAKRKGRS